MNEDRVRCIITMVIYSNLVKKKSQSSNFEVDTFVKYDIEKFVYPITNICQRQEKTHLTFTLYHV